MLSLVYSNIINSTCKCPKESHVYTKVAAYKETNVRMFKYLFKVMGHNHFLSLVLLNNYYLRGNVTPLGIPFADITYLINLSNK